MESRWSDAQAAQALSEFGAAFGEDLALRTYATRLIGADSRLVLHGGGNTSVKTVVKDRLGRDVSALFVKASGQDMASIKPEGHTGLDLGRLVELRACGDLTDEDMAGEFRLRFLDHRSRTPSLETLVHAFLPHKFIDHSHAEAFLALTNLTGGAEMIREAFGEELIVLPYVKPGFRLALEASAAFEKNSQARGMVLIQHGLITWGESARESYERMVGFVDRATTLIHSRSGAKIPASSTDQALAGARYRKIAPILRRLLSIPSDDPDRPFRNVILSPLTDKKTLDFVDSDIGRSLALTPPLTTDYLVRTKPLPLWIEGLDFERPEAVREVLSREISEYADRYRAYVDRHSGRLEGELRRVDPLPRVVFIRGIGAICAGRNAVEAAIVRDITAQAVVVKGMVAALGPYSGLGEDHLFDMEYRGYQQAKLGSGTEAYLGRRVAIVTGAAGAIGSGVSRALLEAGCHVAVTDLAGPRLEALGVELATLAGGRVMTVAMDVTEMTSVAAAFDSIVGRWGGVDLVVINAGLAHVASLEDLGIEEFRRVERVNTEGTLLLLAEAVRHFRLQGLGGDIVLISTKNVFAPGASFGAYSATKAAAHQLARIASLEFAAHGVRVNMVAPDAVFSEGERKSGLWQAVGPDRMKARGLDEAGLEEYYRSRNLLKSRVTAGHVASAVLFFANRLTPTTGATIPVDGGLPDATPR